MEEALLEKKEYSKRLTEYTNLMRLRSNKDKLDEIAELRKIPRSAFEDAGVFYIGTMAEMMIPEFINILSDFGVISPTNNKPIFEERWVFPILDQNGMVQNLVGYKPGVEERYIYGTARYYRRSDTLWGLENMNYAYEVGWCIQTEGITDALRLRSIGYKNSFAHCGTRKSGFIMNQINRCRHGSIRIHDRDKAGERTKSHWISNRFVTLNIPMQFKDLDETCFISKEASDEEREENIAWVKSYIEMCKEWLLEKEHKGFKCECKEATMI